MNESSDRKLSTADVAYGQQADNQSGDGMRAADPSVEERQSRDQEEALPSLMGNENATRYSEQWQTIQAKFVDEPQDSVTQADSLVAEVVQELARKFAEQREQLEARWRNGSEVSTEDLRQALQQYRAFFQRLLAA